MRIKLYALGAYICKCPLFWISLEHNIQSGFLWQGAQVFGFQSFVLFCIFKAFLRVSCIYETQKIFSTESWCTDLLLEAWHIAPMPGDPANDDYDMLLINFEMPIVFALGMVGTVPDGIPVSRCRSCVLLPLCLFFLFISSLPYSLTYHMILLSGYIIYSLAQPVFTLSLLWFNWGLMHVPLLVHTLTGYGPCHSSLKPTVTASEYLSLFDSFSAISWPTLLVPLLAPIHLLVLLLVLILLAPPLPLLGPTVPTLLSAPPCMWAQPTARLVQGASFFLRGPFQTPPGRVSSALISLRPTGSSGADGWHLSLIACTSRGTWMEPWLVLTSLITPLLTIFGLAMTVPYTPSFWSVLPLKNTILHPLLALLMLRLTVYTFDMRSSDSMRRSVYFAKLLTFITSPVLRLSDAHHFDWASHTPWLDHQNG